MVFISYCTDTDYDTAVMMKYYLEANGLYVWMAKGGSSGDSIEAGEDFEYSIPEAIRQCNSFLLLVSDGSQNSHEVYYELKRANEFGKPVIPLELYHTTLTESFKNQLIHAQIRKLDALDMTQLVNDLRFRERDFSVQIKKDPDCMFRLYQGEFQDNLESFLASQPPETVDKTLFAFGIDLSFDLNQITTTGILYALIPTLEAHGVDQKEFQRQIDLARGTTDRGEYGEITFPELTLDDGRVLHFLMIGNSSRLDAETENITGIDTREIIFKIFDACQKRSDIETLFMGAIGSKGLGFPYEVVTSEIINSWMLSVKSRKPPQNLCYSVRQLDMKDKQKGIIRYIKGALELFRA